MITMKKMTLRNEKGFVLLAALIACLILLAIGMLVVNMSTGDLIASSLTVGNKKALVATESGVNTLVQNFNPSSATWTAANSYTTNCTAANPSYIWQPISSGASAGIDDHTQFAVCAPTESSLAPLSVPGYDISEWGMKRYNGGVVGENTSYNSRVRVDIGMGYGPVPLKD